MLSHIHLNECLKNNPDLKYNVRIETCAKLITTMGTIQCTLDQEILTNKGFVPVGSISKRRVNFQTLTWTLNKGIYTPILKSVYILKNCLVFEIIDPPDILIIDNFRFKMLKS